ncbi:hypothetical protein B0H16DRAFT_1762483 [Mycena metata]|uniref:Uncharacterized protein n=1 Tax=Mycena metata TaxID=1033252 RepID=A0AAD7I8R1_9AGAR|nr:hypothetical protein B0H16DRAFT_1762483 [Mycena metata]
MHAVPSNTAVPHPVTPTDDTPTPRGILLFEYHVHSSVDMPPGTDSSTGIQNDATAGCTTTSAPPASPAADISSSSSRCAEGALCLHHHMGLPARATDRRCRHVHVSASSLRRRILAHRPRASFRISSFRIASRRRSRTTAPPPTHHRRRTTADAPAQKRIIDGSFHRSLALALLARLSKRTTTKYKRMRIRTPPHPAERRVVFLDHRDGETGEGEAAGGVRAMRSMRLGIDRITISIDETKNASENEEEKKWEEGRKNWDEVTDADATGCLRIAEHTTTNVDDCTHGEHLYAPPGPNLPPTSMTTNVRTPRTQIQPGRGGGAATRGRESYNAANAESIAADENTPAPARENKFVSIGRKKHNKGREERERFGEPSRPPIVDTGPGPVS